MKNCSRAKDGSEDDEEDLSSERQSDASNHIGHGLNAPTPQRHSHRVQGGFHHRFEVPTFQFVTPLNFEKGLAVEEVRFNEPSDIWRQIVDQCGCKVGGGGEHERYVWGVGTCRQLIG